MTWTGFVLAAGLVMAQVPPGADKAAELAEDVEVMRRILNKAVGLQNEPTTAMANVADHYPARNWIAGNPYHAQPGASNTALMNYGYLAAHPPRLADPFDGVYLKGHGVVYTLKIKTGEQYAVPEVRRHAGLSAGCTVCHHVAVPVAAAKLEPVAPSQGEPTEWDRTRNALRGTKEPADTEPSPTVAPADVCRPGKLAEALMAALMKNGRHLRHLTGGEAVTVVVTLDGQYGPAQPAVAADGNAMLEHFLSGQPAAPNAPITRPATPAPRPEAKLAGFTDDETKQIALGDLHMKQGKPKEAADAYRKALARIGDGVVKLALPNDRVYHSGSKEITDAKLAVTDARKKLAQALLAAGDLEGAKKALDAATSVQVQVAVGADAARKPAPLPVPAKLVLTVKKADLDRADKLTPAEFKKLVTVETAGLPPADKAKK